MEEIDLLLVNPANRIQMYGSLGNDFSAVEPPVWIGLLAAFIRDKGFSVRIIDTDAMGYDPESTVEKILEFKVALIGVGAFGANPSASSTPKMYAARKVLRLLKQKEPELKTFLFGIHPSALTERTLKEEHVDFICKGESFYTVLRLLELLKSGARDCKIKGLWYKEGDKIIANGWGELVNDLDTLPFVAWDMLPMGSYRAHNWHCFGHLDKRQPYAVIYTSLGCPFNCSYCNVNALYNGSPGVRFRSPERVEEEIDFLVKNYNVKNIKILDELFVLREERVIRLCDLLIERNYDLNIWAYARIDTTNKKLLQKMKQAGINWLAYGIESASSKVRSEVKKNGFDNAKIKKVIAMTHDAGINIVANFIFGLPEDNLETMEETLSIAKELNCEYANFYVAMAYPGSPLYEEALRRGFDLPKAWAGYSQLSELTLPLPTRYLSSKEVLRFRDKAFEEYHSNPEYLKMIEYKFGTETVEHINRMLKHKIRRAYA